MSLSRFKLNELYTAIEAAGLSMPDLVLASPQQHNAEERGIGYVYDSYVITHAPSGARVTLDDLSARPVGLGPRESAPSPLIYRIIAFVPKSELVRWRTERPNWTDAREDVANWARTVSKVSETRDLWDDLDWAREYIKLVGAQYENSLFTAAEQELISIRLRQIVDSLAEHEELTDAQLGKISASLAEVNKASARVGRKDWLLVFYGGLFSLVLSGVIPQDLAQHIVAALMHDIVHFFQIANSLRAIEG